MSSSSEARQSVSEPSTSEPDGEPVEEYVPPKLTNSFVSPLREPREWLFLVENRLLVAAGIVLSIYSILVVVEFYSGFGEQGLTPLFYVFGALIGGNFTLITIVISISQLVISNQLGAPGDLRRRIEETNEYRQAVEDEIDRDVAPVTPTDFLQLLLEQTGTKLDTLREEAENMPGTDAGGELEDLVSRLRSHIDRVNALLRRSEVGLFEALSVTLQTNYSMDIHQARALNDQYGDQYPDHVRDTLDELVVRLEQIDVARQYLKTLYMQNELARMSRFLLYAGTPAVIVSMVMMHQFAASTDAVFGPTVMSALVPVALTLGVAPLAILFAYVLRISLVAQRTVAITPFTTPQQEKRVSAKS